MRPDAIAVPNNALVNVGGKPGVFVAIPAEGRNTTDPPRAQGTGGNAPAAGAGANGGGPAPLTARFVPVEVGIHDGDDVEIVSGVKDGTRVITVGAGALKDGDRVVAANENGGGRRRGAGTGSAGEAGAQRGNAR
jgi:multidrug efflux pump subunit AcrA (membrane-fusion protein)